MPGNPITGKSLGECPSCASCPGSMTYIGPDGNKYTERRLATAICPSWTKGSDGIWRLNPAPGQFGQAGQVFPRGSYYIKYCNGAWEYPYQTFSTWGAIFGFNQQAGQAFGPFYNQLGPPFYRMQPRGEWPQVAQQLGAPISAFDWLDFPLRANPPLSAPLSQIMNIPVGPGPTECDYLPNPGNNLLTQLDDPNDYNPQSKNEAQTAAACLYVPFYHAGGPITVDLMGGLPDGFLDLYYPPGGFNPGSVTWALYEGLPLFFLTRVITYGTSWIGGVQGQFDFGFEIINLSRGKWYGRPRISGPRLVDTTVNLCSFGFFNENFPLREILARSKPQLRVQCTAPNGSLAGIPINFTVDDGTAGASGIPVWPFDLSPSLVIPRAPTVTALNVLNTLDFHGKHAVRVNFEVRNIGRGPTTGLCQIQCTDNETVQWPTQSNLNGGLGTAMPGQLVGLAMGGSDNQPGYPFPFPRGNYAGVPYSGCTVSLMAYPVQGETSIRVDFSIRDGEQSWGPFSFNVPLGTTWPFVQGT